MSDREIKVCLSSWAWPWLFAPYGAQLRGLIKHMSKDPNFVIYYLNLGNPLPVGEQTLDYVYDKYAEKTNFGDTYEKDVLTNVKFMGGYENTKDHVLTSELNVLMRRYKIDNFLYLGDLVKFVNDVPLNACRSFSWYPSHYDEQPQMLKDRLALFSDILSLAPSDAERLSKSMPEQTVTFVPHFIDPPEVPAQTKEELRAKHNIPADAYVVFIHCGNYETYNRKSLDTSLFAFEEFQQRHPDAYLVLHAWSMQKIKGNEAHSYADFIDAPTVLNAINIDKSRLLYNDKIVHRDLIEEFFAVSDVFLHGAKVEGFGLPVLEAQQRGLPVVTSAVGAMKDYTYYGISVPSVQREYFKGGGGIWNTVNTPGIVQALCNIKEQNPDVNIGTKEDAAEKIGTLMAEERVANQIIKLFKQPYRNADGRDNYESLLLRFQYSEPKDEFVLYENNTKTEQCRLKQIKPGDLKCKWLMMTDDSKTIPPMNLANLMSDHELIFVSEKMANDKIEPTPEDLQQGIVDMKRASYLIKANIVKMLLGFKSESIENKHLAEYILRNTLGRVKIALDTDNVINA